MSERNDWRALAADYALGMLSDAERAAFEAHLAESADAREEVEELRAVAGLLGTAVAAAEPPARLRERILEAAQADAAAASGGDGLTAMPLAQARHGTRWLQLLAAGVAFLAVLLLYSNARERATMLESQLGELSAELRDAIALAQQRGAAIDALLGADIVVAVLAAPDAEPAMRVYWNRQRGVALVAAFNLAAAPEGRTYQLWGIDTAAGTPPVSLGTFDTGGDGRTTVAITIPAGATFDLAAVTDEPAGGSPQPTTQPFLVGSFAAE